MLSLFQKCHSFHYQNFENDEFYSAETALTALMAQDLEEFVPNGAVFAFETKVNGSENAPYMLITTVREHPKVEADSAGSPMELLDIILTALGHNRETFTTLPDGRGGLRCVGTHFNVGLDVYGNVTYRVTELGQSDEERPTLSSGDMIERSRIIVAEMFGVTGGNAEVFFEKFDIDADDRALVYFGYYIAGGKLHLRDNAYAARVRFVSGAITDMEFSFRNFTYSGEYTRLLPEIQTLAAAGGEFMLNYFDTGPELLVPEWVKREDN